MKNRIQKTSRWFRRKLSGFLRECKGQSVIEYALVLAVCGLLMVVSMPDIVSSVGDVFTKRTDVVENRPEYPQIKKFWVQYELVGEDVTLVSEPQGELPAIGAYEKGENVNIADYAAYGIQCKYYNFIGWKASSHEGTTAIDGRVFRAGESFSMPEANITMTAQWERIIYTITYDANLPVVEITGTVPEIRRINAGDSISAGPASTYPIDTSNCISAEGYEFRGWAEVRGQTVPDYRAGMEIAIDEPMEHNINLYGVWKSLTYEVIYKLYDDSTSSRPAGLTGTAPLDSNSGRYVYGDEVTVKSLESGTTYTGYKFKGWKNNGQTYVAESMFTINFSAMQIINRKITLIAVWEPVHKINYHLQGGTSPARTADYNSSYYDVGTTVSIDFPAGLKKMVSIKGISGTVQNPFVGWATTSTAKTVTYYNKSGYNTLKIGNSDIDLYAVYMQTEYPYNGDSGPDGSVQSFTVPVSGTYKVQLWGAQGGQSTIGGSTGNGAKGGYTTVTVHLTAGQTVYFCVGGHGANNVPSSTSTTANSGGYNGGGNGKRTEIQNGIKNGGGGGGGATSFTTAKALLKNQTESNIIAVAGGGAGMNTDGTGACGTGGGTTGGGDSLAGKQASTGGSALGQGQSAS